MASDIITRNKVNQLLQCVPRGATYCWLLSSADRGVLIRLILCVAHGEKDEKNHSREWERARSQKKVLTVSGEKIDFACLASRSDVRSHQYTCKIVFFWERRGSERVRATLTLTRAWVTLLKITFFSLSNKNVFLGYVFIGCARSV